MRRISRLLLVELLVAWAAIIALPSVAVRADDPDPAQLVLVKAGPVEVLAGEDITYRLSASNDGESAAYNVSFRDVLPPGVSFVPGSTRPADAGNPTQIVGLDGSTTLIWYNLVDIQHGGTFDMTFDAHPDPDVYPVGSSVDNEADVYGHDDPRYLPKFDSHGEPIADPEVRDASSGTVTTDITSIELTKSEPSPEGELLRGVHDQWTTYSLRVRTTDQGDHDENVIVTDLLPAALEFLGCGGVDNSTAGEEYPGSGPLGAGVTVTDCPTPESVETVLNPPPVGGVAYPAGVYTKVTWNLGPLPAGSDVTVRYAAGIPLHENVMFADPAPTADSLEQAANLDNNTGAATRELDPESSITNFARADGHYVGPVDGDDDALRYVSSSDDITRTIEDLRMIKSVLNDHFEVDGVATFHVRMDTSEYTSASGIVVTDDLPNGMCPRGISDPAIFDPVAFGCPEFDQVDVTYAPNVAIVGVTPKPDGGFTIEFAPIGPIAADGSFTLIYSASMRNDYRLDAAPIASGDAFSNSVSLEGTTTPIAETGETGDQTVGDESETGLATDDVVIDKTMRPNGPLGHTGECPTDDLDEYIDTDGSVPGADFTFHLGDIVCFRLRVDFAQFASTRNPVVTDFLPFGVEFLDAEATVHNDVIFTAGGPVTPTFTIGSVVDGNHFVAPGAVFDVIVRATVTEVPDADLPDVRGNLMKLRVENTEGDARSFRDEVLFDIAPAVPVSLTKGVASVDAPAAGPNAANVDGELVHQGSKVTYRIDVTNEGTTANGTGVAVSGFDVWDLLPDIVDCSMVSDITNFIDDTGTPAAPIYGTCTDPGDAGYPLPTGATASVIRWQFPTDGDPRWEIGWSDDAPHPSRTLTYAVTMPAEVSAGSDGSLRIENVAGVHTYHAFTNVDDVSNTYIPADNIDPASDPDTWNVRDASDDSWVVTERTAVTKTGTTSITETGNNTANQAVIGETVTFTYSVVVPARTTVYHGVLSDSLPANLALQASPAPAGRYYPDADDALTYQALPAGFSVGATDGTLTFPTTYTNTTELDQRFEVTVTALVTAGSLGQTNQPERVNTATFNARSGADPTSPAVPPTSDDYTTKIIQPTPTLTKANDAIDGLVDGDDTVTFTLTASTAANRPILHDAFIVDCIPSPLVFDAFDPSTPTDTTFGPAAGNPATNGCATGTTYVAFKIGDLMPGTSGRVTRSYTATVPDTVVGGDVFINTATLTGGSLDDDQATPQSPTNPNERTYTSSATSDVTVRPASLTKSVSPTTATIGDPVTYTVVVTVPENQQLYDLAVIDSLPAGLSDITLVSSECVHDDTDATPCVGLSASLTGPVPDPAAPTTRQLIAFLFGDAAPSTDVRTITITYTAVVDDVLSNVAGVELTNTATPKWNASDVDPAPSGPTDTWGRTGGSDDATVTVEEPLVTVAKSVSDTTPEPGDTFTYNVVVTNDSGDNVSDAYNVEVSDLVPVGVVVDTSTISGGGSYDAVTRTITWPTIDGPLAPGASVSFTYTATLAASATIDDTQLVNTASVDGYDSLPTDGRHYSGPSDSATVTPQFPELTVTKSVVGSMPTYLDTPVTWRVKVTNTGGGTAYDLDITDSLPPNWGIYALPSPTITLPGAGPVPITTTITGLPSTGQTASWSGILPTGGDGLAPGQSATIEFVARALPGAVTDPGVGSSVEHTNLVDVSANDASGASGNLDGPYEDDDDATARIDAVDLLLEKTGPATVHAGANMTWEIVVSNPTTAYTGTPTDTAVGPFIVTDTLPAGVTFVSATGTGWTCSSAPAYGTNPASVQCVRTNSADTLAPDASFAPIQITVAIPADVVAGTTYTNSATVEGRTFERNADDNTDDATTTTTTSADLEIIKRHVGDAVAGQPLSYVIDVTNLGPSVARTPITVTDELPAEVAFDGTFSTGPGWSCTYDSGTHTVECVYGNDLGVGVTAPSIEFVVDVKPTTTDPLSNTATVESPTDDPDTDNNSSTDEVDVDTLADLELTKVAVESPDADHPYFVAGGEGMYNLTVVNHGPSVASGVTITDTLPDYLTYEDFNGDVGLGWGCSAAGQEVTCTLADDLAVGESRFVYIVVSVAADHVGDIYNSATVSSETPDDHPENNTDTTDTTSEVYADLGIVKTGPADAHAGEQISWTLDVTNHGPADSVGPITVTDTLPDGVAFVSATGSGWVCDGLVTPGVITCTRAAALTAADGSAPTITVVVDIDPSAGAVTLVNTASVAGTTEDRNPSNNTDHHNVPLTDLTNLTIDKTLVGGPVVNAGDTATFEIVVTNEGPSTAASVSVVDTLPDGMVATAATGAGWTCVLGSTITCTRATLEPGVAPTITVVATVASGATKGQVLVNEVEVTTATPETDLTDNSSSVDVEIDTAADLAISKSHEEERVYAGDDVVFTIVVENLGPSTALGPVVVHDTLPAGFTYVAVDGPWSCVAAAATPTGQEVTCTLLAPSDLLAGLSAPPLLMTVAVASNVPASRLVNTYINVASVDSGTDDPNEDNNTTDDPVIVGVNANMSIVKTLTSSVRIGDDVTFELAVHNDGPSIAEDVQVVDVLDPSLTFVSASGTGWTCVESSGTITCDLADPLDAGDDAPVITIVATVTAGAYPSVDNTATVSTSTSELDLTDNTSTVPVEVPALVDLGIVKTAVGDFVVGQSAGYTFTVTNYGPTAAPGPIVITDPLPAGLTVTGFDVSLAPGTDCSLVDTTITCSVPGPLAVDDEVTVGVTVVVGPAAAPSVANTASVSSPSEDTDPSNDSSTTETPVTPVAVLSVTKELTARGSGKATWTITVTNAGPSATWEPIVAVDALPVGLTYVSAAGTGWVCAEALTVVTCTYAAPLGAEVSASFEVVTAIGAPAGGTIVNGVTVDGGSDVQPPIHDDADIVVETGDLPGTGSSPQPIIVFGLLAIALGAVLVVTVRRRRLA